MRAARMVGKRSYEADDTDYEPYQDEDVPHHRTKRLRIASTPPRQVQRTRSTTRAQQRERLAKILRPGRPPCTSIGACRVPDRPSPPLRPDDKDGHYVYEVGENISSRFKILSKMGEGTFGRVLECWDRRDKDYVALKIVRNVDKYRHAAMIELEVLHTLQTNDPGCRRHCVTLREWFDYRGHVCMVFDKLGPSLYDFMRRNDYEPFSVAMVQDIGRQLLQAVAYMHDLRLVHTDLKPENILLLSGDTVRDGASKLPASSRIRVIDFGSATFEEAYHCTVVSTRHYRAPEVILGLGWSYPADVWSLGCILAELITGDALFQTHENMEHLAMMQQVLGVFPSSIIRSATRAGCNLFLRDRLHWPEQASSDKSVRAVNKMRSLEDTLAQVAHPSGRPHLDCLCSLLRDMLQFEPNQRITPHQALRHPFFSLDLGNGPNGAQSEGESVSEQC